MSFIDVAEVEFTTRKSCFISLPKSWHIRPTNTIVIFKIRSLKSGDDSKEVLMSWSGETTDGSDGRNIIEMNGLFANKCGFSHRQNVLVSSVPTPEAEAVMSADKCHLKPITENDWEILSMNAEFIESNLLNQIRVVASGQVFPVWITSQSNVCLFVEAFRLLPNNAKAIILNHLTEVVVCRPESSASSDPIGSDTSPKVANKVPKIDNESDSANWSITSMFGSIYRSLRPNDGSGDTIPHSLLYLDQINIKSDLVFDQVLRVSPFPDESDNNNKDLVNIVFISDNIFKTSRNKSFICKLSRILSPNEKRREKEKSEEKKNESEDSVSVSKRLSELDFKETFVAVYGHKRCPDGSVFICDSVRRQMGLSISSRVHLKSLDQLTYHLISELILCPINVSPDRTVVTTDCIKSELSRLLNSASTDLIVLTNGSLIRICDLDFLTFNRTETGVYLISRSTICHLKIDICEPFIPIEKPYLELHLPLRCVKNIDNKLKTCLNPQYSSKPFAGFDNVFNKCLNFLSLNLKLNPLANYLQTRSPIKSNCLLVYGQKGSGKTHLMNALMKKLSANPDYVYIEYIDCRSFKGKRIDSMNKLWNNSLAECLHYQPSLLVFDDLDAIASVPLKPGQEMTSEAVYSERVAKLFADLMDKCSRKDLSFGDQIAVIATSRSTNDLQNSLMQTRGKHVFHDIIEISSPEMKQRVDIISSLVSYRFGIENIESHLGVDLKEISNKSKGYSPIDLTALVDRALHNCYLVSKSNDHKNLVLTEDNFNAAFDGFCPLNLRGLDLELKSNRSLAEVGGLADVKKCLKETILWSLKYPLLFSRLPLKAQSSIMLFGPPGTGKTLLIEAIANECGINFIGVKGPELLSKYVGQSEQSVRDVFNRAQIARPCILFFDEFDALAPRRGHDSTGVTDRVVNQLLTQMDGFEQLGQGVYVLAATSRPDLIDLALLRPGRFDKCLHCPLPNQSERLEILNALSTKLEFSEDVDLEVIARQSEHFSGADLQAVLYSAQLDALHACMRASGWHGLAKSGIQVDQVTDHGRDVPAISGEEATCDNRVEAKVSKLINNERSVTQQSQSVTDGKRMSATASLTGLAINQRHLLAALESSRPSISETERIKYNKIYQTFISSGGQSFQSSAAMTKKKVTLA